MSEAATYSDGLASLDAKVRAAEQRWQEARKANEDSWQTGHEVARPLADHYRAVEARTAPNTTEGKRQATLDLLRAIEERGLILEPVNPGIPRAGVRVVDPNPPAALAEAHAHLLDVRQERGRFASEHSEAIQAEADRARMGRIRDALQGDDPTQLREAMHA